MGEDSKVLLAMRAVEAAQQAVKAIKYEDVRDHLFDGLDQPKILGFCAMVSFRGWGEAVIYEDSMDIIFDAEETAYSKEVVSDSMSKMPKDCQIGKFLSGKLVMYNWLVSSGKAWLPGYYANGKYFEPEIPDTVRTVEDATRFVESLNDRRLVIDEYKMNHLLIYEAMCKCVGIGICEIPGWCKANGLSERLLISKKIMTNPSFIHKPDGMRHRDTIDYMILMMRDKIIIEEADEQRYDEIVE